MFRKVTMEDQKQHQSFIVMGKQYQFNLNYEYWDFRRKLHDYDGIPCNNEKGYSKDLCFSREIEQQLLKNFGCTTPFGLNKTRICSNATIGRQAYYTYRDAIQTDSYRSCFNPCTYFSISTRDHAALGLSGKSNGVSKFGGLDIFLKMYSLILAIFCNFQDCTINCQKFPFPVFKVLPDVKHQK